MESSEIAMRNAPEDLAVRCRSGDLDALRLVYEQQHQGIYRLALRLMGNQDDAADIRQDTFVIAFETMGRFRGDCTLKTWLFAICAKLCRSRMGSPRRRREIEYEPAMIEDLLQYEGESLDPRLASERAEMARLVRIALGSLPSSERELIILRECEGLEYEEIARIQGCSASTIGVKLFRARRRL